MTSADFTALLPLIILGATSIAVTLSIAIRRNHAAAASISIVGLVAALWSL